MLLTRDFHARLPTPAWSRCLEQHLWPPSGDRPRVPSWGAVNSTGGAVGAPPLPPQPPHSSSLSCLNSWPACSWAPQEASRHLSRRCVEDKGGADTTQRPKPSRGGGRKTATRSQAVLLPPPAQARAINLLLSPVRKPSPPQEATKEPGARGGPAEGPEWRRRSKS